MTIEKIIKENLGTIIDVRTSEEFSGGHVSGSMNIPLQEISGRMNEIKTLKTPLVLCCASGGRSGVAQGYIAEQGIECLNAGSWLDLNYYQSQKAL